MPKSNYLIAVQYGDGDTVMNVIKVKSVNDQTYRSLLNKKFEYDQKQLEKQNTLVSRITTLEETIEELKKEIKELKGE